MQFSPLIILSINCRFLIKTFKQIFNQREMTFLEFSKNKLHSPYSSVVTVFLMIKYLCKYQCGYSYYYMHLAYINTTSGGSAITNIISLHSAIVYIYICLQISYRIVVMKFKIHNSFISIAELRTEV